MSAIRPDLPMLPPPPAAQGPVRGAARSDFFKAALDAVQAAAPEPAPRAAAPRPATATTEDRPTRPGALLDIRV